MFLSPTFWLFCTSINLCSNELKCRWDRENENKIQNSAKFPETILLSRMIVIIVCFIDDQVNTLAVLEEIKMRWDWDEISGWRFKAEIWLQFTIGVSQVSSYCALQSKRKKHLVFLYLCFVSLLGGRNGNVSYPSRTSIARHVSSFALCYISHLCIH